MAEFQECKAHSPGSGDSHYISADFIGAAEGGAQLPDEDFRQNEDDTGQQEDTGQCRHAPVQLTHQAPAASRALDYALIQTLIQR